MTDSALTSLAILVELGLPIVLAWVAVYRPTLRARSLSILGALALLLTGYLVLCLWHLSDPERTRWALGAVWLMSFVAYVALALVGLLLALVPTPRGPAARFFLGALVAPLVAVVGLLIEPYVS